MLTLLLTSMLTFAFNIQLVKTGYPLGSKLDLSMFPPTLDGDACSMESPKCSGMMELKDGRRNSTTIWVPFDDARSPRPPQWEILRSDEQTCVVTVTIHGMYKERIEAQERQFEKLTVPEYGFSNHPGKPQLPVIRGLIEIPLGKSVTLTATTLHSCELFNYTIYPAQEPTPESCEEPKENVFQYDQAFYSIDAYYPYSPVSVSPLAQLRDHVVVQLSICPIRFNPATHRLNVSICIKIRLEYYDVGEAQITTFNRLSSLSFDDICKTTIWNYDFSKPETVESEPVGYLVITNDTFYSSMIPFVEWKMANGFNVTSVKLSHIGVDANDTDIYNYIYTAYHDWTTPPTYVLLVGDVEYLPTHYGLDHPYEDRRTATDHYYACVSGSDYLPDLFVGRLAVKSVSELNNTLNKLIGYNGFFNERATLVSDTEHFEETSNWIYDFLSAEGYTVDKLYKSLGTATASNIADALDEGRAIINYRGHGSTTGWATGSFYNSQVLGLNNEGKLPIVISCTCSTGEYDNDFSDCFGETWLKVQGRGAVAFWGSSRVSYSGYNDELSKGVCKAIFNDRLYEFGPITVKAKLYMYNYYGDQFFTHLEYEMYNILTDPQLCSFPQHELIVGLDSPDFAAPEDSILLNATVSNIGLHNETEVELSLMINANIINSTTISELPAASSNVITYLWTPTIEGIYNVTAYVSPVPSETYTWNNIQSANVLVQTSFNIMIVVNNNGSFHVQGTSLPEFESALTTAGYDYMVWNETSMDNPPLHFLTKFKLVIWTCGDYWNEAVDSIDAATLESYLTQGGNILLEGEDIGYDHNADSFMINVAHATYQVDDTGAPGLMVTAPSHPVTQGLPANFTWTIDPPYDDGTTPTNIGMEVIQYTGTSWTAVTVFEGTVSKVVYFAFPLYCLDSPEQEILAINSINWLLEPARAFGWVEDREVSNEPIAVREHRPSMTTDSNGDLYVAYEHYDPNSELYEIHVSKSMDNGETWGYLGGVYDVDNNLGYPSIAIDVGDNNNIYVAFEREWTSTDHDVFVLRYVGSIWGISSVANVLNSDDRYPSITSEYQSGTVDQQYISYEYVYSYDDRDLMFAKSDDDGATWSIGKLHGWWDGNVHCQTSIATTRGSDGNDYIYIAYKWGADYSTAYDVVIDKSSDRGDTWTQQWICDESSRNKNWPSITATHGGGTVVIAWHVYWSSTYLNDIQYAYSTDNGDSWDVGWLALEMDVNEETPILVVDGLDSTSTSICGCVHVAYWKDNGVYYREASFSSPGLWTAAEAVTDTATYVSAIYTKPAITTYRSVCGRYLPAVAWTNWNGSSYDICYSTKGPMHTIDSNPPERIAEVDLVPYAASISFYWIEGSTHMVNAPSPQYVTSDTRYVFENWSDYGTQSHIITAGISDQNVTAYFKVQYRLQVTTNPGELPPQPIVTPPGPWHANGTLVNCMAQDGSGYSFDHWMVDEVDQGQGVNPIVITMNEAHTAIAHYAPVVVKVLPDLVVGYVVGQSFSVAVVVQNVVGLYGLDVQLSWNATYLEYVNHTVTIPVEEYPVSNFSSPYAGILHEPTMKLKDIVDESASIPGAESGTMAWLSYSSIYGAPPGGFNGSGTICIFTFRVKAQSIVDVEVPLHFIVTGLSTSVPSPIPHTVEDSLIIIPRLPPDIAVTNLTICYGATVVPQNVSTWINVTVTNEGSTNETFTLTVYWNSTNVIDSTTVVLLIGETKAVKFAWNTSTLQRYSNYTISAYATPVADEVDTVDNTYVGDTVILVLPGDVDADKDVDLFDAVAFLLCYGVKVGNPKYNPNLDIDNDGQISLFDAVILLKHYGQKDP